MKKALDACRMGALFALTLGLTGCGDSTTDKETSPGTSGDSGLSAAPDAGTSSTTDAQTGTGAENDAGSASDAATEDATMATTSPADYSQSANWLCRPDANEACAVNLDTTIVKADGTLEKETFQAATDPAIDCFYVYPTVSLDETPNSDLVPGKEERDVVRAQFARFASQCRLFAPMYRQVTLTALRASLAGMPLMADRALGYKDVQAAFRYYLEHDNQGRGFVLVGHSQGSSVLTQLLKDELDKDPGESRFMGAMLLGTNVLVPKGQVVGGTFQHLPLCTSAEQLGCIIVYASFRKDAPPPDNSLFAVSMEADKVAACTNPAALGGGAAELHSYLSTAGPGASGAPMGEWVEGKTIDTPFVSVPGMISAECTAGKSGSYLAITVQGDPADPRTDDIVGDVVTGGQVQANWGLHLIDAHLTMGNLLDVVKSKTQAYKAR